MPDNLLSAPERAKKLNFVTDAVQSVLVSYGYSEIFLPLYEYYEILEDTAWNFKDDNIIRFIDRNTGKSLVLRPDFTPQVCRVVSSYMKDVSMPIRLSYKGRIFRNVNLNKGIKSEKYQVGCELFYNDEIKGDLELLLIIKSVLEKLGIANYKIVIGDKKLLSIMLGLIDNHNVYVDYLTAKNYAAIREFIDGGSYSEPLKVMLKFLPYAYGDVDLLKEMLGYADFSLELIDRINYLIKLVDKFIALGGDKQNIVFDAGETRGLDYYTGVNIDIYSTVNGSILGGGGRYDSLMEKFGFGMPACGIAFNAEEITPLMATRTDTDCFDYLAVGEDKFIEAEELRRSGKSVCWVKNNKDAVDIQQRYKFSQILM